MVETKNAYNILVGKPARGRHHLKYLGIDGRKSKWTGFIWLMIGFSSGFL
jgi:hypothetical protein